MATQVAFYEEWIRRMRALGYTVHEAAGWKTRDAAPSRTYSPGRLYVEHHDASSARSGNWGALNYILNNRLANIVTARDGQITMCAAGPQNHAGVGSRPSLGNVPANGANWNSMGNEVANNGLGEAYDPRCTRAIIAGERVWAEISGNVDDLRRILGHKEWADPPGRKTDPTVDMDDRRSDVAAFTSVVTPVAPEFKFPVQGAIRKAFDRHGGLAVVGQPTNSEGPAKHGGLWQAFQHGRIYWHPSVAEGRAHRVQGGILEKFVEIGSEWTTGYPVTDELSTPDTVGRYNHFEFNHSIYWHPDTGTHVVHNEIRTAWAVQGWEVGSWGYPDSDPYLVGDVLNQDFQGGRAFRSRDGSVFFDPKTPVVEGPPVVAPPTEEVAVFGLPVPENSQWRVSSPFGPRSGTVHRGVDIAAPEGTDLLALEDGEVTNARVSGTPSTGFGFVITVRHVVGGQVVDTVQGHMRPETCLVKVGDKVKRGQKMAEVGEYGGASGPHSHVEVCVGGWYAPGSEWVDPAPWLGLDVVQK